MMYNLDVVIAVGYRVNSYEATQFVPGTWEFAHEKFVSLDFIRFGRMPGNGC